MSLIEMRTIMLESNSWEDFFGQCLRFRVQPEELESLMIDMDDRYPINGSSLAKVFLQGPISEIPDPLILLYFDKLLTSGRLNVDNILHALLNRFQERKNTTTGKTYNNGYKRQDSENLITTPFEDTIFNRVAVALANGTRPKTVHEARNIIFSLSKWTSILVTTDTTESILQAVRGTSPQSDLESSQIRESFGMLLISALENTRVQGILQNSMPKGAKQNFAQSLALFASYLSQTCPNVTNRLELLQSRYAAPSNDDITYSVTNASANVEPSAMKMTVLDLPLVNSRGGPYIFLNSLLIGQPLTDDELIMNYLGLKYKNDIQALTKDLIIASFDILSNAFHRSETPQTLFCMRSFLVNKLPLILSSLHARAYQQVNAEVCVAQSMAHIDPNAFPSFSQTFDIMNGMGSLPDVRQDFLFSCALHQLISEESIEKLLGEPPMSALPSGGRYVKEELIRQCSGKTERLEELLGEIESMDGNAGAIVGAFVEVTKDLCHAKETITLKSICNIVSKRPQSMDIILQFISPHDLLQPLCQLLSNWKYEEDQGEYQPVYDEFGSIFLLVIHFVHRYHLNEEEIGAKRGTFISDFLIKGYSSKLIEDLSDNEKNNIGDWLRGLLDPDGFSDELMSSCKPQQFYMLVPTLFFQMVAACTAGLLEPETLKVGLEYLLETFLLPSLIGAISWMTYYARHDPKNSAIVMQILHKLILPSSISGDAKAIHSVILSIVAQNVTRSLRFIKSKEVSIQGIDELLEVLNSYQPHERSPYSTMAELGSWKATSGETLKSAFRYTLQTLFSWSSSILPSYSHKLVLTLVRIIGARRALRLITEELKVQSSDVSAIALDIATALITAPSTEDSPVTTTSTISKLDPVRKRLNLREALRIEASNASSLFASAPLAAETIARLDARVEAQLAFGSVDEVIQAPVHDMVQPMDITTDESAVVDPENMRQAMDITTIGIDLGVDNPANEFDLGQPNAILGSADDDIFAGINLESSF